MLTSKAIVIKSQTCLLRHHVANKIVIALLSTKSPLENLKFNSSFAFYTSQYPPSVKQQQCMGSTLDMDLCLLDHSYFSDFLLLLLPTLTLCWGHRTRINYIVGPQQRVPQFEKIETRCKAREMKTLIFLPKTYQTQCSVHIVQHAGYLQISVFPMPLSERGKLCVRPGVQATTWVCSHMEDFSRIFSFLMGIMEKRHGEHKSQGQAWLYRSLFL